MEGRRSAGSIEENDFMTFFKSANWIGRSRRVGAAAFLCALFASCSGGQTGQPAPHSQASAQTTQKPVTTAVATVASSAPTLATINRLDSVLSDSKGKWVLVNIWATWCRPCVVETPDLVALYQSLQGKPYLSIGLSTDLMTSPNGPIAIGKVDKFRQSQKITYPMYIYDGSTDDLVARFKLSGAIPTSILYNPQGQEVERWVGILGADDLARIRSRIS